MKTQSCPGRHRQAPPSHPKPAATSHRLPQAPQLLLSIRISRQTPSPQLARGKRQTQIPLSQIRSGGQPPQQFVLGMHVPIFVIGN